MSSSEKFQTGDKVVIVDEDIAREWYVPQDIIEKLTPLQPLTVSEINKDTGGGPSVCLQEDEYSYNWPMSALAHAPSDYPPVKKSSTKNPSKPDGDKWFELFYLGLEQGYSIDAAAERADKAYLIYENRVEGL